MTGLEPGDATVNAIVGTFFALKSYAKFDSQDQDTAPQDENKKKNVVLLETTAMIHRRLCLQGRPPAV